MWLLLAESGSGEVGGLGRAQRLGAAYLQLLVALTCIRWYHPPLCPQPSGLPPVLAMGLRGGLRQREGQPPSSGVFKDM